jgi:catalase
MTTCATECTQTIVHQGRAPYLPNSIDGGHPLVASAKEGGYVNVPRVVDGEKVRDSPASFADHFSQATLFWSSLTDVEKDHLVEAFTFELGKCFELTIRGRTLANLANVDTELCARVAAGLGLKAPSGKPAAVVPSPALSQITGKPGPIAGRVVGVVAGPDSDLAGIARLRKALAKEGAILRVIAETGGTLATGDMTETVDRTLLTTRSIEYDAVVVAAGSIRLRDPKLALLLSETNRHFKVIGSWGDGDQVLSAAGVDTAVPGVVTAAKPTPAYMEELIAAIRMHRAWDRVNHAG